MESVLSNYEEGVNFWKLYPSYKAPKIYKKLYDGDKSKSKSTSSKLMWALHFLFDRTECNPWKRYSEDDRAEVIKEDILDNPKFDFSKHESIMSAVKKELQDEEDRMYLALVNKMDERSNMLSTTAYNIENARLLDDAFLRTEKMREEIIKVKDSLGGKGSSGKTKGDVVESFGEQGLI